MREGFRMSEGFYCKPAPGERIETRLTVTPDRSAAIHGVVLDPEGAPLSCALVLLFLAEESPGSQTLLAEAQTDAEGHFAFGCLEGDVLYRIKVFQQGRKVRVLELRAE